MALIENLEHEGWEKFLRDSFRYALEVLKNDRFRSVGSSVDDLKSWLTAGGVARVSEHLNKQMEMRRFPLSRKSAINDSIQSGAGGVKIGCRGGKAMHLLDFAHGQFRGPLSL